ncbi:MAG: PEP/pyruvate-binding domain-containing protein [Thermodesulfobacteriota bacterium]
MTPEISHLVNNLDPRFTLFHELMAKKVKDILLVSSLYDACIMEEDCRLAEKIINEYRGLNLSKPPRLTWVSTAEEALSAVEKQEFDLVITMPRLFDMDAFVLGREIKKRVPTLPVHLLIHTAFAPDGFLTKERTEGLDRIFVWSGNADLLLAMIKNVEDRDNVHRDTQVAGVRVILFVEDSPQYLSSILPILYREVVSQTQAVLEEKLNEEHRLLTMRARAKILIAQSYEEAIAIYEEFKPYLLGVISDVRFTKAGRLDENAGVELLSKIMGEIPDIPVLLTSSEPSNREKAASIPASFIDKNSPTLYAEIHTFFLEHLGFGDFIFRLSDGREVGRVSTVRALEKVLAAVPVESFIYHGARNDFSRWLFARSETMLAAKMRPLTVNDFDGDSEKARQYLVASLQERRKGRQKGVVVDFDPDYYDPDTELLKIGQGSLGGKARGLVFLSTLLQRHQSLHKKHPKVEIIIPQTLVITTESFDAFVAAGDLKGLSKIDAPDEEIAARFLETEFPAKTAATLRAYLAEVRNPLAVRSSSLLEDSQHRAYAGLYRTYMIPNNHCDIEVRLKHLLTAVKLVYASTYFQGPKSFARRVGQRTEEEKMAVIVQEIIGGEYQGYFYPVISGVAQSHNYYPFARMKPEDGIATIALGLGKTVVEGHRALRFSPKHPQIMPQFATVESVLNNSQHLFYALKLEKDSLDFDVHDASALVRRDVSEALNEAPVQFVASTYIPEEHRIKDSGYLDGPKVLTFAQVLKYKAFPLAELLADALELGHAGMGCPVEIEFSVDLCPRPGRKPAFVFLQIRPMTARAELMEVEIEEEEIERAFCYSTSALGNSDKRDIRDIIYVKPEVFDPARTPQIAQEIGRLNTALIRQGRSYVLIGPGRWGSADRWLGIPVQWADISGVGAIVETTAPALKAEPSQGSHFFHNVTTLGINYLTVSHNKGDFLNWNWLSGLPRLEETNYVAHAVLESPFVLKVDGRKSHGVIYNES